MYQKDNLLKPTIIKVQQVVLYGKVNAFLGKWNWD